MERSGGGCRGSAPRGCEGSGTAASSDPDPDGQAQVGTSEKAREDSATVSARLTAAGYDVLEAVANSSETATVVMFDDGGVVVILMLDSNSQADVAEQGFKQSGAPLDLLLQQAGRHLYAANLAGETEAKVSKEAFDKLVVAGEGT